MASRVVAVVAVELLEDLPGVGLAALPLVRVVVLVVEEQMLEPHVAGGGAVGVQALETAPELVGEPDVGAAVARRLGRLVVELQHALRVGEGALGLRHLGRREEEDLGLDVGRLDLAALDLRRVLPERRALVQPVVLDDQPLELAHPRPLELGVQRGGRVLPDQQHALDAAVVHRHEHRQV